MGLSLVEQTLVRLGMRSRKLFCKVPFITQIRLVGASSPEFEIQGCAVSQWNIGPGMQGLKFA
jgi:hypothetical protein